MPMYEYFCKTCDGVFEARRSIAESSAPAPCPVCAKKAKRIPPTSVAMFVIRDGYPRAIPDRGTYYHLGKEVKKPITGAFRMNEHPELAKPRRKPTPSKGEIEIARDKRNIAAKEERRQRKDGVPKIHTSKPRYSS